MRKPKNKEEVAEVVQPVAEQPAETQPLTKQELLAQKRRELEGVSNAVALYARELTSQERGQIDDLESKMQFLLQELVTDSQIREAIIKIETMRASLDIIKKPVIHKA